MIRIRTSKGCGGATMISSITNGSPAFLLTAALHRIGLCEDLLSLEEFPFSISLFFVLFCLVCVFLVRVTICKSFSV
jgi:hypothetical protein